MKILETNCGTKFIVDAELADEILEVNWCLSGRPGRAYVAGWDPSSKKNYYLHRLLVGAMKGELVDHINGNRMDNRRSNLRRCTSIESLRNRSKNKFRNASGFKGVMRNKFSKHKESWIARIGINGESVHLGCFPTKEDAARAYNHKAQELFGEFAKLNDV